MIIDPLTPKYIRVEARVDHITREVIRTEVIGQTVETEDRMGIIGVDKTIETTIFKGTLEDMEGRIIEESIEVTGTMNMIEVEIGQEKEHFQETMVTIEIGVPVTVDQDQDLKLVPTGAG